MKRPPITVICRALAFGLAAVASAQKGKTTSCGPDEYLSLQVLGTPTAPSGNVHITRP